MTDYARLNDPVAYGDIDESDETLLDRARENLTIEGLDDQYLDFQVESNPREGDKVVFLMTLFKAAADGHRRVQNDAVGKTLALEVGDRDYFDHIWDSRSVEDDHVFEEGDD